MHVSCGKRCNVHDIRAKTPPVTPTITSAAMAPTDCCASAEAASPLDAAREAVAG